jgi:hypothetical protein
VILYESFGELVAAGGGAAQALLSIILSKV